MARPEANKDLVPGLRVVHVWHGLADVRLRLAFADGSLRLEHWRLGQWTEATFDRYAASLALELAEIAQRLNFDGTGDEIA
jgi:hypothetical protein